MTLDFRGIGDVPNLGQTDTTEVSRPEVVRRATSRRTYAHGLPRPVRWEEVAGCEFSWWAPG
jgi:hypothetical protein